MQPTRSALILQTHTFRTRIGRLVPTLVACLLLRALIPIGYMPGSIPDGEWMMLCPVASAETYELMASPGHAHHGARDADAVSVGDACPIGSALALVVVAFPGIPSVESAPVVSLPEFNSSLRQARPDAVGFSPRAPPAS